MPNKDASSPLADVRYSSRAYDLVRFEPDPADILIARVLDQVRSLRAEALSEMRSSLTADENYLLLTFARRQAARALRDHDLTSATDAIAALTLVDRDKVDFRDLSVDFPLFAVRELGGLAPNGVGRDRSVLS